MQQKYNKHYNLLLNLYSYDEVFKLDSTWLNGFDALLFFEIMFTFNVMYY
jgi:hypothetical protein